MEWVEKWKNGISAEMKLVEFLEKMIFRNRMTIMKTVRG